MKKMIFLIFILLSIILIYLYMKPTKKMYLILGTSDKNEYILNKKDALKQNQALSDYNTMFLKQTNRITDLLNDINNKIEAKNKTILNYIIKADYITMNIGQNDFDLLIENDNIIENIDELIADLERLFKKIRTYSKEEITFISINSKDKYKNYVNNKIKILCNKYNILYIE